MKKNHLLFESEFVSDRDFRIDTIDINIYRGKFLSIIIILIELLLAFTAIVTSFLQLDQRFHYYAYLFMYVVMIVFNIIFLFWINSLTNLSQKSDTQLNHIEGSFIFFVAFVMCWGSIVSLMDQRLYGQITTFAINALLCSVIYHLKVRQFIIPLILSALILLVGLPFFQPSKDILIGHYFNLGIFLVICFVASRIVFKSHCNQYLSRRLLNESKEQLEEETRRNIQNNERLKEMNQQLKKLSFLDELTKLPNRRSFRDYVDYHFDYLKQNPKLFSIIMIDVDHFKQLNDQYGHNSGDVILKKIGQQINASINIKKDFAARWGGDEFIYASFDQSLKRTLEVANLMRKKILALSGADPSGLKPPAVTVSLGVCTLPIKGKNTVSHCIDCADQALYAAKTSGRNCLRYYESKTYTP